VPRTREPKNLDAGPYAAAIRSFRLHLSAEGKSPKTVRTYIEAVQWFAAASLLPAGGRGDWSAVTGEDVNVGARSHRPIPRLLGQVDALLAAVLYGRTIVSKDSAALD
jgi:hypothetical protein